jgi:hypothetical protein
VLTSLLVNINYIRLGTLIFVPNLFSLESHLT